jgi:hypothetical protein
MDSVDLMESPLLKLRAEAKRRKRILLNLFGTWIVSMSVILALTYYMKEEQQRRLSSLQLDKLSLAPRVLLHHDQMTEYSRQARSTCTAMRLRTLFSSPVDGLYLTNLSGGEIWSLAGVAVDMQALDQFRMMLEQHFENAHWEEVYSEKVLSFTVQGKLSC